VVRALDVSHASAPQRQAFINRIARTKVMPPCSASFRIRCPGAMLDGESILVRGRRLRHRPAL
jgi:hypothetical protein